VDSDLPKNPPNFDDTSHEPVGVEPAHTVPESGEPGRDQTVAAQSPAAEGSYSDAAQTPPRWDGWVSPPPKKDESWQPQQWNDPWQADPWVNPQYAQSAPTADDIYYGRRERPRKKRRFFRFILTNAIIPLTLAFAIAMFLQATIAKPYQIPSGSMLPTIQLDDRILANRLIYHFQDIKRGDVIVFQPPAGLDNSIPYVKRVIGLPGDTVEIKAGKVMVNGEELVFPQATNPNYARKSETVPEGQLFVLGDNRNESSDSHVWGYVPKENVIGRADVIYWPPPHIQWLGH
jgi:signal peptidase I